MDAPEAASSTPDVVAWTRPGGCGVRAALEGWGVGGRCHLDATPVGTDGTPGTTRRLTDTATSRSPCAPGHAAVAMHGGDPLFHLPPEVYVAGDGDTGDSHVVRRVADRDDGGTRAGDERFADADASPRASGQEGGALVLLAPVTGEEPDTAGMLRLVTSTSSG